MWGDEGPDAPPARPAVCRDAGAAGVLVGLPRYLGGGVEEGAADGFPPVDVLGSPEGLAGGVVRFGRSQSSQFLSAVLQVAPYARNDVTVDLEPRQTSWPYVAMT